MSETQPPAPPPPPTTRALDSDGRSADAANVVQRAVALVLCPRCAEPLRQPVTLPCGRTLCRGCLPQPRARAFISYPSSPSRLQGFECPFGDCQVEHASEDCALDVVLSNALAGIIGALERAPGTQDVTELLTRKAPEDFSVKQLQPPAEPETALPIPELEPRPKQTPDSDTWVAEKNPGRETDQHGMDTPKPLDKVKPDGDCWTRLSKDIDHAALLDDISESMRPEVDCQVCYALFYDAVTTQCGHTFCRHCLQRILDHSELCAVCRQPVHQGVWPGNQLLASIERTLWPEALEARKLAVAAEGQHSTAEFDIPLFVCTLSFPSMPTFLHVFEPRYRLMIRRSLEQDRTFGMVLHRRARRSGEPDFVDMGTLLRIVNVEFFPDGRSLLETVGVSRFRVMQHGMKDGYVVAKIQRLNDISIAEEEILEAAEIREAVAKRSPSDGIFDDKDQNAPQSHSPEEADGENGPAQEASLDIDATPTLELLRFAVLFVQRMRDESAGWLTNRILAIYGECPEEDAARFPWWFASVLPVNDLEKYRLLGTESVRQRLKICCRWILEWEASRW